MAYKQHELSSRSAGGRNSKIRVPVGSGRAADGPCSPHPDLIAWRIAVAAWAALRGRRSHRRRLRLKTPHPNAVARGVRFRRRSLRGDANRQTTWPVPRAGGAASRVPPRHVLTRTPSTPPRVVKDDKGAGRGWLTYVVGRSSPSHAGKLPNVF